MPPEPLSPARPEAAINGPPRAIHHEPRWSPALAILAVLLLLRALPGHVAVIPVWVSYVAALAVLGSMAAVAVTRGSAPWLGVERAIIVCLALVYGANTLVELAAMLGVIRLHPSGRSAFSQLASSVAIWVVNVLAFSLLYWQLDRGGPGARARGERVRPDWVFPQPAAAEDLPSDWRPLFLDYLYLGYNTATAFTPADVAPLTRRAKVLMMLESMISLLTTVVVLSRALNASPS
jgi:hypothetical protein